jgi:iron-sulfur cluster insertion protein
MLTIIQDAQKKIKEILLDEPTTRYVRAFISGGGCAGFNHVFTIEDEKNEDDFIINKLLVDSLSMQYFDRATIDYKTDKLQGSQFVSSSSNSNEKNNMRMWQ